MQAMIAGVHQESQGHLEDFGHFEGVEGNLYWGPHQTDHRRHAVAADGEVLGQRAQYLDLAARDPGFFLGFAQRGVHDPAIALFGPPPGERDLAGMVVEMIRALRENDAQAVFARNDGNQDGGRAETSHVHPVKTVFVGYLGSPDRRLTQTPGDTLGGEKGCRYRRKIRVYLERLLYRIEHRQNDLGRRIHGGGARKKGTR